MLLTSRNSCEASKKRPKAYRSSSIWWKQHKQKQTERIFQSKTSMSTLCPSRLSLYGTNTRQIPTSGKNSRHKNKPGQSGSFFCEVYAAKQQGDKAIDAVDQPFGGAVSAIPREDSLPAGSSEIMDSLAVYLDNCGGCHQKRFSTGGFISITCSEHGYPGRYKLCAGQVIRTTPTRSQHAKKEEGRCNWQLKKPIGMPQLRIGGPFRPT